MILCMPSKLVKEAAALLSVCAFGRIRPMNTLLFYICYFYFIVLLAISKACR